MSLSSEDKIFILANVQKTSIGTFAMECLSSEAPVTWLTPLGGISMKKKLGR